MAEIYNRTLVETKAAMLLIPQSARVLAKNRPRANVDASRIADLRKQGWGWRKIAAELGVGVGTVMRATSDGSLSIGNHLGADA